MGKLKMTKILRGCKFIPRDSESFFLLQAFFHTHKYFPTLDLWC
jgi:hypothetical protein